MTHEISSTHIDFNKIESIISSNAKLALSKDAVQRIENCRNYLDKKLSETQTPIYGINTGFGSLYDKSIDTSQLEKLQENLVMSHACGIGDEAPQEIINV
jgi:histidine ammonia-lyase